MVGKMDVKETKELILGLSKIIAIVIAKNNENEKFTILTFVEMVNDMLADEDISLAIRDVKKVIPELKDLQASEIAEILSAAMSSGAIVFKKIKK